MFKVVEMNNEYLIIVNTFSRIVSQYFKSDVLNVVWHRCK